MPLMFSARVHLVPDAKCFRRALSNAWEIDFPFPGSCMSTFLVMETSQPSAVEQTQHIHDSSGLIMALAFKEKSSHPLKVYPLRSAAVTPFLSEGAGHASEHDPWCVSFRLRAQPTGGSQPCSLPTLVRRIRVKSLYKYSLATHGNVLNIK